MVLKNLKEKGDDLVGRGVAWFASSPAMGFLSRNKGYFALGAITAGVAAGIADFAIEPNSSELHYASMSLERAGDVVEAANLRVEGLEAQVEVINEAQARVNDAITAISRAAESHGHIDQGDSMWKMVANAEDFADSSMKETYNHVQDKIGSVSDAAIELPSIEPHAGTTDREILEGVNRTAQIEEYKTLNELPAEYRYPEGSRTFSPLMETVQAEETARANANPNILHYEPDMAARFGRDTNLELEHVVENEAGFLRNVNETLESAEQTLTEKYQAAEAAETEAASMYQTIAEQAQSLQRAADGAIDWVKGALWGIAGITGLSSLGGYLRSKVDDYIEQQNRNLPNGPGGIGPGNGDTGTPKSGGSNIAARITRDPLDKRLQIMESSAGVEERGYESKPSLGRHPDLSAGFAPKPAYYALACAMMLLII